MTPVKLGSLLSDRYSLIRILGSGTGSTVYLAADVESEGKQVAIKVVGGSERGEVLQEFFEREVAVLSVVRHSNVIRLLDHGLTPDGQPWLVLEYAEGGSLGEVKNRARFRTEAGITRLLQKCTSGLLQAHLEGVLHRDLKPSNILFDVDRRPKLADFNVSKLLGRTRSLQTLRHFFTVRYASPEQRLGRAATEKSDIYSLGLIAAELMIGEECDDVAEVIRRIPMVEMSGSLKRLVNVMLSEDPDRRPTTPQLLAELNDLAAHHQVLPPIYFRLSEGAAQQIANIQGPGVTVSAARQIVTEDLQTPLLLDLGRSHVEGENPSFVWVGQRFIYFTRPNNEDTPKPELLIAGIGFLRTEVREQRRSQALQIAVAPLIETHAGAIPQNGCITSLRNLVAQAEMAATSARASSRMRDDLLQRWEMYLEVLREQQFRREILGDVVQSDYSPDKHLYHFTLRNSPSDLDLEGEQVTHVSRDGVSTPVGHVTDQSGARLLVRPHDNLPEECRFATGGRLCLDLRREQVSIDRQDRALRAVRHNNGVRQNLGELLTRPETAELPERRLFEPLHNDLDKSTKSAIESALGTQSVFLIQGPPGTGKTTVISEVIAQIRKREPITTRILVASQSNVAVDNVLQRLKTLMPEFEAVRLGHTEKIGEAARAFELGPQLETFAREIRTRAESARERFRRLCDLPPADIAALRDMLHEALAANVPEMIRDAVGLVQELLDADLPSDPVVISKYLDAAAELIATGASLTTEMGRIQEQWIERTKAPETFEKQLLASTQVVAGTCLGFAANRTAAEQTYDWVIIDEAGRATAPEVLVPLVRGRKFVLVGDHKQLPPILDEEVAESVVERLGTDKRVLKSSLFEELFDALTPGAKTQLRRQYRMHPAIGDLIASTFYPDGLEHGVTAEDRAEGTMLLGSPVRWLDTSGLRDAEEQPVGTSYMNRRETTVVVRQLVALERAANKHHMTKTVGVLSAYTPQVELLRTAIDGANGGKWRQLTIDVLTVDAAQGREFDIVFYSAVRSNAARRIGFLADERRLNVALSRAREALTIVGDIQSLTGAGSRFGWNPFRSVVEYFRQDSASRPIQALDNAAII